MRVFEFLKKNEKDIKKLNVLGLVNGSIISQYRLFKDFDNLKTNIPLMQRYCDVAERNRVSERTVMNAVKKMRELI